MLGKNVIGMRAAACWTNPDNSAYFGTVVQWHNQRERRGRTTKRALAKNAGLAIPIAAYRRTRKDADARGQLAVIEFGEVADVDNYDGESAAEVGDFY